MSFFVSVIKVYSLCFIAQVIIYNKGFQQIQGNIFFITNTCGSSFRIYRHHISKNHFILRIAKDMSSVKILKQVGVLFDKKHT